ncbi:MAG TPA: NTP transferase domain-containing protein [Rhizomicrobium sp.]|nr:NTP transferase domain-containing protein [Rhizomicrobium sp.]
MASESESNPRTASEREHIRVVAVIQARMGTARLPGKVLRPAAGQPLLWHIVHRLQSCRLLEDIAVATTTNPADEAIVEWCNTQGVTVVRGPEDDVLACYALAAEKLDADVIVRVSSDAPFIDAGFVDHLIATLIEQDGDYVLLEDGNECAHEGVDPFSRRALDRLMMDAAHDRCAREHVTGYFKLHPDFVKSVRARAYAPIAAKNGRFTVDTPDDLAFVEAVHARLDAKAGEASLADLLLLLEREPDLKEINAPMRQKPIAQADSGDCGRLALIRCDGGGKFGYGHVKRMVALARALRDREGIGVIFALNGTEDAAMPIRRAGFAVTMLNSASALAGTLESLVGAHQPDILLLDGREGPSRADVEKFKRHVAVCAAIDDGHERRLACDFAYYPPVPGACALDWSGSNTLPRLGWEWAILGLNPNIARKRVPAARPTVLVAMGGSDPQGLTLRMARALAVLDSVYRIRFVIGTGMKDADVVARGLVGLRNNYETVEGADDLSIEYTSADMALCAFGVTAYELAACGVPALYLGLTADHAVSASAFADAGMGLSLGVADKISDADIARNVQWLLNKPSMRREMRRQGMALIDGQGAARIAADLAAALTAARTPLKTAL